MFRIRAAKSISPTVNGTFIWQLIRVDLTQHEDRHKIGNRATLPNSNHTASPSHTDLALSNKVHISYSQRRQRSSKVLQLWVGHNVTISFISSVVVEQIWPWPLPTTEDVWIVYWMIFRMKWPMPLTGKTTWLYKKTGWKTANTGSGIQGILWFYLIYGIT